MVEGKKSIKNGMDRLKVLIFNDYRFKAQHQYKNYKNDTLFEMIEFRKFFAVTLISIFSFPCAKNDALFSYDFPFDVM